MAGAPAPPEAAIVRVLLLVSLVPALVGAWAAWEQHRRIETWRPVPALILRAEEYTRHTRGGSETHARIRYRYRAGGRDQEGETLLPGPFRAGVGPAGELVARYPAGTRTTAWHDPDDPARAFLLPVHAFLPYFVVLTAAPILALAAGLATGGVRHVRSEEREVPPPKPARQGRWQVEAFRPWLRLRDSALAALVIFGGFGAVVFGHYVTVERAPGAFAALTGLAWLLLLGRLAWAVIKRTLVGGALDEARVVVTPPVPRAGEPLEVRVEQAARRELRVRALEVTLVGERTVFTVRHGRTRAKTATVVRQAAVLQRDVRVFPHAPLRGAHTFAVPADAVDGDGFLRWRVEVRTRLLGADYRTRFPLAEPDDDEDDA